MAWQDHVLLLAISVALKLLLFPSYHSTDFEVHRNWMSITHALPLHEWYFHSLSEWTLDYPPFFAYFEWLLARCANWVDPRMLILSKEGYDSDTTVAFQRGSVIVTELLLYAATWYYLQDDGHPPPSPASAADADRKGSQHQHQHQEEVREGEAHRRSTRMTILALVSLNAGLVLVDHIHFQYNGVLMGLLVLTLALAKHGRPLAAAAVFSVLVLSKHLFLTLAPAVAVYLLVTYCGAAPASAPRFLLRLTLLAAIAGTALLVAFAPFYLAGEAVSLQTGQASRSGAAQLMQILARLFPFGRGLVHAYWAPNVWALYYTADRVLSFAVRRLGGGYGLSAACVEGISASGTCTAGLTLTASNNRASTVSGLVGEYGPALLPAISSAMSVAAVLLSLTPALYVLVWRSSSDKGDKGRGSLLTRCTVYSSLSAFMLGYHVHEKAILVPMLLQALLSLQSGRDAYLFLLLASAGTVGLFPLFTALPELLSKTSIAACYLVTALGAGLLRSDAAAYTNADTGAEQHKASSSSSVYRARVLAVFAILLALVAATEVAYPLALAPALPFLPLLSTSAVCALVLLECWRVALLQLWQE